MSQSINRKSAAEQPMYIVWILLLLASVSLIQLALPTALYPLVYGVPEATDWFSVPVYEFEHAVLWKERVWFGVIKVGPNSSMQTSTLASFDPDKGDLVESTLNVPSKVVGFVGDDDRLWGVTLGSVIRIEGKEQVEYKPKRKLGRPSQPFIHGGKVAVLEMTSNPNPELLIFEKGEWNSLGGIAIPFGFATTTVDGGLKLIQVETSSKIRASMMDAKVLSINGKNHLFISDGAVVAYRQGIEMARASALTPANTEAIVDTSDLTSWEPVCQLPTTGGRGGRLGWKAALFNGEPIVITTSSGITNPLQRNSLLAYGKKQNEWREIANQSTPAMLNLVATSDSKNLYAAVQSFAQTLRIFRMTPAGFEQTGAVLKAPVAPFQEPIQRWSKLYQWGYWLGLLILALGVSRLMSSYLGSEYQFGNTTVELASLTRRGFAKLIDIMVFWLPNYLLTLAFGLGSQEQIAENMDKFFDTGPGGLMVRLAWLLLSLVVTGLLFFIVNSFLQGRWGLTLGKWICGIRTLRTTLRPCGFSRALFRELLIVVDTLFGMTIVPVTLAIAFSTCRQRLGDMAADTLVIRLPKQASSSLEQTGLEN